MPVLALVLALSSLCAPPRVHASEMPPRGYEGPLAVAATLAVRRPAKARARDGPNATAPERAPALPLPGPPAERRPPGAAHAAPGDARKLSMPRREPEDIALFVPRVVLAVPRFVLAGVFTGVSGVLSVLDDAALARVRRVFVWNRAETLGWHPIASFQGGYGFSLGARVYHENAFGHREAVTLETGAGGIYLHAHELRLRADRLGGSRVALDVRVRYDRSPRLVFAGLGDPPAVHPDDHLFDPREASVRTRYTQDRALAALRLAYELGSRHRSIRPGLDVVFNHRRFGRDRTRQAFLLGPDDRQDRSTQEVYDVSRLPGFVEGVDVARLDARVELDFRDHRGMPSRGFRFVGLGGGAPPQVRDVAFGHYGAEATGYFDLFARSRVLVLRLAFTRAIAPLPSDGAVRKVLALVLANMGLAALLFGLARGGDAIAGTGLPRPLVDLAVVGVGVPVGFLLFVAILRVLDYPGAAALLATPRRMLGRVRGRGA